MANVNYGIIDAHIHQQPWRMLKPEILKAMAGSEDTARMMELMYDTKKFITYMDEQGIEQAWTINYVSPDIMGFTDEVNDYAVASAKQFPKRIIPFGSIHPLFTKDAGKEMDRIIKIGIRGIKIHSVHQLIYPNAYRDGLKALEIIYKKAENNGLPVMFHTGTSIFKNARAKYGDPIYIDDVAVDFPNLKIILAHGGRPIWMETAVFLVRRHKNVFMDISSVPPQSLLEYFPKLEKIADKVLYGSDWPGPGVRNLGTNIQSFLKLPLTNEAKRNILRDNASKIIGR